MINEEDFNFLKGLWAFVDVDSKKRLDKIISSQEQILKALDENPRLVDDVNSMRKGMDSWREKYHQKVEEVVVLGKKIEFLKKKLEIPTQIRCLSCGLFFDRDAKEIKTQKIVGIILYGKYSYVTRCSVCESAES